MLFGIGLAFFLGKPYIQPVAPDLPAIPLGWLVATAAGAGGAAGQCRCSSIGIVLAVALAWMFRNTRWGLIVRMVGDSADAARAMGYRRRPRAAAGDRRRRRARRHRRRLLSLYYPGQLERGHLERARA